MLHGRAADIHGLLADARAGRSAILVIAGEAGSGKTALLEHVAADAKDFRVLRCTGVESEAELPFAALHLLLLTAWTLCHPVDGLRVRLPRPRRPDLDRRGTVRTARRQRG